MEEHCILLLLEMLVGIKISAEMVRVAGSNEETPSNLLLYRSPEINNFHALGFATSRKQHVQYRLPVASFYLVQALNLEHLTRSLCFNL